MGLGSHYQVTHPGLYCPPKVENVPLARDAQGPTLGQATPCMPFPLRGAPIANTEDFLDATPNPGRASILSGITLPVREEGVNNPISNMPVFAAHMTAPNMRATITAAQTRRGGGDVLEDYTIENRNGRPVYMQFDHRVGSYVPRGDVYDQMFKDIPHPLMGEKGYIRRTDRSDYWDAPPVTTGLGTGVTMPSTPYTIQGRGYRPNNAWPCSTEAFNDYVKTNVVVGIGKGRHDKTRMR